MRTPLRQITAAWLAAATIVLPRSEGRGEENRGQPVVLTGRVEQVYTKVKQLTSEATQTHFVIEVHIPQDDAADGDFVGRTIFVKTWQLSKPPKDWQGPRGQADIPERGDIAEFRLTAGSNAFEAQVPDGIRIILPGASKSASTGLDVTLIHPGKFAMGSAQQEPQRRPDELQHLVKILKPFYLGTFEVTQFEYRQVMRAKPSAFAIGGGSKDKVPRLITDRFPVESVSWFDSVEFCNRLSEKDGLEPFYAITEVEQPLHSIVNARVEIRGGHGYRLPTEAEWEYACRAGTTTPFSYGMVTARTDANVKAHTVPGGYGGDRPKWQDLGRTAKVGSYPPNEWGLFDMHGNVEELCEDWYDKDAYSNPPSKEPQGFTTGTYKVARGGSWLLNDAHSRSASRIFHMPREAKFYGGFRVARTP